MDTYYPFFKVSQQENEAQKLIKLKIASKIKWLCIVSNIWHAPCSIFRARLEIRVDKNKEVFV
jgi:hypothetical protein